MAPTYKMATSKLAAKKPTDVPPGKSKILIFGPSGVGKTWFAMSFPKPFYLDTERGATLPHYKKRLEEAGGGYIGTEGGTLDPEFVIGQMEALAQEEHPYQTLVIDSITKLYQTIIANEANRLGNADSFGASKKPAIGFMRRLVMRAQRLDMNIVFVAQEITEWGKGPGGQREEVGKIPDVWDKLVYELDLGLQVFKRGPNRICQVHKSRLVGFPHASSFLLEEGGKDVGYKQFSDRYGKDYIEAAVTRVVLATDAQVGEIERLLKVVPQPEDFISKTLDRAQATCWKELTTQQAQGTIDWLTKRIP